MKKSTLGFLLFLVVGIALGAGGVYWWLEQTASPQADNRPMQMTGPTLAAAVEPAIDSSIEDDSVSSTVPDDSIGVDAVVVEKSALVRSVAAVGSLSSENSVMLRPEITGRISAINFQEGGPVTQGQVLIELDSSVARAQLAQAEAALALASSQYRRAQELTQKGFISGQARDESASELKVQQAAVAMAKAQLD